MSYEKEGRCPHRPIFSLHLEPAPPPAPTWRLDQLRRVLAALLLLYQPRQ